MINAWGIGVNVVRHIFTQAWLKPTSGLGNINMYGLLMDIILVKTNVNVQRS